MNGYKNLNWTTKQITIVMIASWIFGLLSGMLLIN